MAAGQIALEWGVTEYAGAGPCMWMAVLCCSADVVRKNRPENVSAAFHGAQLVCRALGAMQCPRYPRCCILNDARWYVVFVCVRCTVTGMACLMVVTFFISNGIAWWLEQGRRRRIAEKTRRLAAVSRCCKSFNRAMLWICVCLCTRERV